MAPCLRTRILVARLREVQQAVRIAILINDCRGQKINLHKYMHQIVIVSGAPSGAGKTTLAKPLADALGFSLIAKDDIKETMFDALDGPPEDRAYSRSIGGASMALLWMLATRCPKVVLEANFRPYNAYHKIE
jgi:hypothetical protein